MMQLKSDLVEILRKNNDDWVEAIREGEASGGIDLSQMIAKNAQRFADLDKAFLTAQERQMNKKGGWFR